MNINTARRDARLAKFWAWFDEAAEGDAESVVEDAKNHNVIYPEELDDKILLGEEELVVVDTRTEDAYKQHHVPGALRIEINNMIGSDALAEHQAKTVVLVCDVGETSLFAAVYLKKRGFGSVYSLDGGINAWVASGCETEAG